MKYIIRGYEGLYWVTKHGDVFGKRGKLKPFKNANGYLIVALTKNKKHRTWLVHRLVLLTLLPNPQNKPQVNHINSIRDDNRLENLEWCTPQENMEHMFNARRKFANTVFDNLSKTYVENKRNNPEAFVPKSLVPATKSKLLVDIK